MNQITARPAEESQVVCGEMAYVCICDEPPKHDGPHLCKCRGSWRGTLDGPDFEVIAYPPGVPLS